MCTKGVLLLGLSMLSLPKAVEESSKMETETGITAPRAATVNGEKVSRPLPLLPG